jgi:hypothetical protein
MKKTTSKTTTAPAEHIHIGRDDRARTNAGKTVNSKVRSQGRTLAAMERAVTIARIFQAEEAKSSNR